MAKSLHQTFQKLGIYLLWVTNFFFYSWANSKYIKIKIEEKHNRKREIILTKILLASSDVKINKFFISIINYYQIDKQLFKIVNVFFSNIKIYEWLYVMRKSQLWMVQFPRILQVCLYTMFEVYGEWRHVLNFCFYPNMILSETT